MVNGWQKRKKRISKINSFWIGRYVPILIGECMSKSTGKSISKYANFMKHWVGKSDWKMTVYVNLWNNSLKKESRFVMNGLQWLP